MWICGEDEKISLKCKKHSIYICIIIHKNWNVFTHSAVHQIVDVSHFKNHQQM